MKRRRKTGEKWPRNSGLKALGYTGEKGSIFRESAESKAAIGDLRRAQAEAEIRCFE